MDKNCQCNRCEANYYSHCSLCWRYPCYGECTVGKCSGYRQKKVTVATWFHS